MYLSCCDVEISECLKKYLPLSGVFIDVGSGVGYFSVIASLIVGKKGKVHSFEPSPVNARAIRRMIENNKDSNIIFNECALGSDEVVHNYYIKRTDVGTMMSMIGGLLEKPQEILSVKTQRLDDYLEQNNIKEVSLIKIDVEGYEYYVLKGTTKFFERIKCKPPIICEIFIPAYQKGDLSLNMFHDLMTNIGYNAFNIYNPNKRIDIRMIKQTTDVIFLDKA